MPIAAARDVAFIVNLARLIASWRQPEPGADIARADEILGPLDSGHERGGGDGADARHAHHQSAGGTLARYRDEATVQVRRLDAHGPPRLQQRHHDRGDRWPAVEES